MWHSRIAWLGVSWFALLAFAGCGEDDPVEGQGGTAGTGGTMAGKAGTASGGKAGTAGRGGASAGTGAAAAGSGGEGEEGGTANSSGGSQAGTSPGGSSAAGDAGAGAGDAAGGSAGEDGGAGGAPQGGTAGIAGTAGTTAGAGAGGEGGGAECDPGPRRVSVTSADAEVSGASTSPAINADGSLVVFASTSRELVSGDSNSVADIFAHDPVTGITERLSVSSAGVGADGVSGEPSVSSDGRFVAFTSRAKYFAGNDSDDYSDIFVHDRQTHQTTIASIGSRTPALDGPDALAPAISGSGRYVAFLGSNLTDLATYATNVYVYDRTAETTALASVTSGNVPSNENCTDPAIGATGAFVVFSSQSAGFLPAPPLLTPQIFRKNMETGALELVSQNAAGERGNDSSTLPAFSADERFVAFVSRATDLVAGDDNGFADVFVRDLAAGVTTRVSVGAAGVQADGPSLGRPSISADGRYVAFVSEATNLVAADDAGYRDAFLHDRLSGTTRRLSQNAAGIAADRATESVVLSADGLVAAFDTNAANLVANDLLGFSDVFATATCNP